MTDKIWPYHRPYTCHQSARNLLSADEWLVVLDDTPIKTITGSKEEANHPAYLLDVAYTQEAIEGGRCADIEKQST